MDHSHIHRELIAVEAADWFLRLREDGEDVSEAFAEWLTRSPIHIEEYVAVSCAWIDVTIPDAGEFRTAALIEAARDQQDSATVVQLRDFESPHAAQRNTLERRRNVRRWSWIGVAAALLLSAGAWIAYGIVHPVDEYSTIIGEQRSVSLADGSIVFLNTNSAVRLHWTKSQRYVDLIRGEARFQVAKNRERPFIVATTEAAVRAVGTVFNVRIAGERTQVAVVEGRVLVSTVTKAREVLPAVSPSSVRMPSVGVAVLAPSIELAAGERAAVSNRGIEANAGASLEGVLAWTQRRLVFRAESLAEVVAEFNRYRTQQLVIDDPRLAALEISGSFDSSDPESLIAYLQDFETVQVEHAADGSMHLAHSASTSRSAR